MHLKNDQKTKLWERKSSHGKFLQQYHSESPHVREYKSGLLGFWIPQREIRIPDSKAQDSGFHKKNFPDSEIRIPLHGAIQKSTKHRGEKTIHLTCEVTQAHCLTFSQFSIKDNWGLKQRRF